MIFKQIFTREASLLGCDKPAVLVFFDNTTLAPI
jgi:hypothetical protein